MREKLLSRGPDSNAGYELVEMLLFFAMRKGDTKPLVKSLINRFGTFANVLAALHSEHLQARGLEVHDVDALKLVQTAAIRLARARVLGQPVLANRAVLMDYLNLIQRRGLIEQLSALFLDGRNHLVADDVQRRGTVNFTLVYPREILKRRLTLHAGALILMHNHPGDNPTRLDEDIEKTRGIRKVGQYLSVAMRDHVIAGNASWVSLRRRGQLYRTRRC